MKRSTFFLAACTAWAATVGGGSSARAATFVVTTTEDEGQGSLRQAILDANTQVGADDINFNIPDGGLKTIAPVTELPAITETVTIDGYTQPGSKVNAKALGDDAQLMIELSGQNVFNDAARGLFVTSDNCVVRGLVINRWSNGNFSNGIVVRGSSNTIEGCFIGTDAAGEAVLANGRGVVISGVNNGVGGTTPSRRNVISGNVFNNVYLLGDSDSNGANRVQGNLIGTDASGTRSFAAPSTGVLLTGTADNLIGGAEPGARNVICGNFIGISLDRSSSNRIQGNFIGVNASGDGRLANNVGVILNSSCKRNLIGGPEAGAGNAISGNVFEGISFVGTGNNENRVQGNRIGTDMTGVVNIRNATGIELSGGNNHNLIGGVGAGNQISGNFQGVFIGGGNSGLVSTGNRIQGNIIGIGDASNSYLSGDGGIGLGSGAQHTLVGGSKAGEGNLISSNTICGISISSPTASGNVVQGNKIGTDAAGTRAVGNLFGITLDNGAHDNLIGGPKPGQGNLISGNEAQSIDFEQSNRNVLQGNRIGTDVSGTRALPNGSGIVIRNGANNTIGGLASGTGNLISGNKREGVLIGNFGTRTTPSTSANAIKGNLIGTDISGKRAVPNEIGILVADGATGNLIGGTTAGERNIVSGNRNLGISLEGDATKGNAIRGNFIGTDISGTRAVPNVQGVYVLNARANTIGGAGGARNLISGNTEKGVWILLGSRDNRVQNNLIGTDISATRALPNATGVEILQASNNLIGGPGMGNLLSGNLNFGVSMIFADTSGNRVQGNRIGTNGAGLAAIPNGSTTEDEGDGVRIVTGADGNIVGGTARGEGNLISGNLGNGIIFRDSSNNRAQGNLIGTNADGSANLANGRSGVLINASGQVSPPAVGFTRAANTDNVPVPTPTPGADTRGKRATNLVPRVGAGTATGNLIGGTDANTFNVISGNTANGITVTGDGATGNSFLGNSIFDNGGLAIELIGGNANDNSGGTNDIGDTDSGPNGLQNSPILFSAEITNRQRVVRGAYNLKPNSSYRFEFFANDTPDPSGLGEGQRFIGFQNISTDRSGGGTFSFSSPVLPKEGRFISALATDAEGNTSKFGLNREADARIADLRLTGTASPNPIAPGQDVTFTFILSNFGPNAATNVRLNDSLEFDAAFISSTPAPSGQAASDVPVYFFDFPIIRAGETRKVVIRVRPSGRAATIVNSATARSEIRDPDFNNNTVTQTVQVSPFDATAQFTVMRGALRPISGGFAQSVTLTNNGPNAAPLAISLVLDNLTQGVTLSNADGQTQNRAPIGSPYKNAEFSGELIPPVAAGKSVVIELQFQSTSSTIDYTPRVLVGPGTR